MNSQAPMIVHSFTSGSSSYFLATRAGSDVGDPIKLTLCDGTSAWTGQIQAADLKPPKNCSAEDFRRRLLQGLCGAETANNSTVAVARSTRDADDAELKWSATKTLDCSATVEQPSDEPADLCEALRAVISPSHLRLASD